jgi:hypothetical protein
MDPETREPVCRETLTHKCEVYPGDRVVPELTWQATRKLLLDWAEYQSLVEGALADYDQKWLIMIDGLARYHQTSLALAQESDWPPWQKILVVGGLVAGGIAVGIVIGVVAVVN